MRKHGPAVAQGPESLGAIAIRLLNEGVRPFLVKWHSALSAFEDAEITREQKEIGAQHRYVIDEAQWEHHDSFYQDLETKRLGLLEYVGILAKVAGVDDAHEELKRE